MLTKDNEVKRATSSYINDILVEEAEVTAEKVKHIWTDFETVRVVGKQNGSGSEVMVK